MNSAQKFPAETDVVPVARPLVSVDSSDLIVDREVRSSTALEPIGDLDGVVSSLKDPRASSVERAHGVLAVVRKMVRAETGHLNLSAGLGQFLEQMWSGPTIGGLVRSLVQRATVLAHGRIGGDLDESELVRDLHTVVEWYTLRKSSLAACRHEGFTESDPDCLFNLTVARDVERWGVSGMEVGCGLRFIARAHETLWFKVTVRRGREYAATRSGWESWRDETDTVSAGERRSDRFAAIVPIRPVRQRTVIDHVSAFVPYEALDLPEGRSDVELEAGIYTHAGELVVSVAVPEMIQSAKVVHGKTIVAPQAIGVWERNAVSGDELSALNAHARTDGDPGWEEQIVDVNFDLSVVGWAGERLEVEARLRTLDGAAIERSEGGEHEPLEPPVARRVLLPHHPIAQFHGVTLTIALADAALDRGPQRLLVEVVVCAPDGRVVCGAVEPVEVNVMRSPRRSAAPAPVEECAVGGVDAHIDVHGIEWRAESLNGNPGVVLAASVSAHDWAGAAYRLLVELQCVDGRAVLNTAAGDAPVLRSIWFGGEAGVPPGARKEVRTFFDGREFARFLKTQPTPERDIVARATIFSSSGRAVFEASRRISSECVAEVKAAMPPERPIGPVQIAGLEPIASIDGAESSLVLRLALNVQRSALRGERCTIYYEFLDNEGQPSPLRGADDELPGAVVSAPLPFVGAPHPRRWCQVSVVVDAGGVNLDRGAPSAVRVSTFSPTGEFWECVQQSLPVGAVELLRKRLRSERHTDTGGASSSAGASSASGESSPVSGLLSRVRSALIG